MGVHFEHGGKGEQPGPAPWTLQVADFSGRARAVGSIGETRVPHVRGSLPHHSSLEPQRAIFGKLGVSVRGYAKCCPPQREIRLREFAESNVGRHPGP